VSREADQPAPIAPQDAAAVDALAEAGFDPAAVSGELRARAAAVSRVLGLLARGGPAGDRSLGDVTFARVAQLAGRDIGWTSGSRLQTAPLTTDDEQALEAWITRGFDLKRVPHSLRARAERLEALAAMVSHGPALDTPSFSLADGVMTRIQAEMERQRDAFRLEPQLRANSRFRLADLMSVAAVLFIGAAVVWPVLAAVREQGRRALCTNNLFTTASAMSSYAGSNRDSLPMARASLGGGQWWDVGSRDGHANSANLYTLVRDGYATLSSLACPGNPNAPRGECDRAACDWNSLEEVSYSMQLVYGPQRRTWDAASPQPVLADRSPVVLQAIQGLLINPFANAPNHRGEGQCVLFTDGSVRWYVSPFLQNGDNIWLPREIENRIEEMGRQLPPGSLSGRELPDGADDTVLGP
jgi:hypothetical protein